MNNVSGACCLVTGGAGFVGSTIAEHLLAAGASRVCLIDNFVRGSLSNLASIRDNAKVEVVKGDIRDRALIDRSMDGVDYVFHQAALRITRCAEAPREAIEVLVDGTLNVLEAAARHSVKRVIAASSASVYGDPNYIPIDEEHPFNNRTMYGAGKIAMEQMLRAYFTTSGLSYNALRYFNVYGPRMDLVGVYTEVLIRWLDAIETKQPPLIFGDGSQSMDFAFIDDVARANLLALEADTEDEVFNVGTGVQTTLLELCNLLLRLTNSSQCPEFRPARTVANVRMRQAETEKAERLLGFKAEITLEEGLRRLIKWRQQSRSTVERLVEAK
jgi:UDP-glucose 4-epimerase